MGLISILFDWNNDVEETNFETIYYYKSNRDSHALVELKQWVSVIFKLKMI